MRGGRSFEGRGGLVLINRGGVGGGEGQEGGWGRTGGQFVRGSYKSFKGVNLMVLGRKKTHTHMVYITVSAHRLINITLLNLV